MTGPGPAAAAEGADLEVLRWNWGDAYEIRVAGGRWSARRADGLGGLIVAAGPDGLREAILADYRLRPVPRDAGGRGRRVR